MPTHPAILDSTLRSAEASEFEAELCAKIVSQKEAVHAIVDLYQVFIAGLNAPECPVGSLLFLGPTGSGKTRDKLSEYIVSPTFVCGQQFPLTPNGKLHSPQHAVFCGDKKSSIGAPNCKDRRCPRVRSPATENAGPAEERTTTDSGRRLPSMFMILFTG